MSFQCDPDADLVSLMHAVTTIRANSEAKIMRTLANGLEQVACELPHAQSPDARRALLDRGMDMIIERFPPTDRRAGGKNLGTRIMVGLMDLPVWPREDVCKKLESYAVFFKYYRDPDTYLHVVDGAKKSAVALLKTSACLDAEIERMDGALECLYPRFPSKASWMRRRQGVWGSREGSVSL